MVESVAAIIGAVGGTSALIEVVKYFANRKTNSRMAETEATREDFHLTQELMAEIKDKTRLIRELNEARLTDAKKIHDLQLNLYDKECKRRSCAFRQPLKPFTPSYPANDMSVFEYFNINPSEDNESAN